MRTKALFVAMLLALAPLPSVAQDLGAGITAYNIGDYATALREFEPLAEQGDAFAQAQLGIMYKLGKGLSQDDVKAARWYRLAAEQGNAIAQSNLGSMYAKGEGVLQDYVEAVRWYRAAAKQRNALAQFMLGGSYFLSQGVELDIILSHMWVNIAAANGYDEAPEARDNLAKLMTSTDIAEAQRRARVCMESDYQDCE